MSGEDISTLSPYKRARRGLCLVPEGHAVFPGLTVRENLLMQMAGRKSSAELERVIDIFPSLKPRLRTAAGKMSGGEQQMLALARCFMNEPTVVLLDEASMGLAPRVVDLVFEVLDRLVKEKITLLLVEQYVNRALEIADVACLLNRGTVSFCGPPGELDEAAVLEGYLGEGVDITERSAD